MESTKNRKIPLIVFTGFLGSGKTTLVNALINSHKSKKIGVVVNEFGEVGFDSEIIQTEEEIKVEISNGCACCVVRDDLELGVKKLIDTFPELDYIFIEASGLAEPEPIVQTFMHNIAFDKTSYLDATVCVIDTVNFVSNWDEFKILQKQLGYCDIVVLSKTKEDGNKKDEVLAVLKKAKPDIQVIEFDDQDPRSVSILIDNHSFELQEVEQSHTHWDRNTHDHDHKHEHEDFDELVYVSEGLLDPNKLDAIFKKPQFDTVIRGKGFLNFAGQETSLIFQLVGHGRQLSPYTAKLDKNKLILIGKHLDSEKIMEALRSCEVK